MERLSVNRRLIFAVVACAMIAIGAWWVSRIKQSDAHSGARHVDASVTQLPPHAAENGAMGNGRAPAVLAAWARMHFAFSQRTPQESIRAGDLALGAETQEQADWLNRNMFPTHRHILSTNGSSGKEPLPHDLVPRTVQDILNAESVAMMDPARNADAKAVLNNGAMMGSAFALQALSRVAGNEGRSIHAAAYLRAAYLRGDWATNLPMRGSTNIQRNYEIDLTAYQVIQGLNAMRSKRGLPPLSPDVRPGIDEAMKFLEMSKREQSSVPGR